MPTLCWGLSGRYSLRGPRLSKQRFGGRIDERHLARCRIRTRVVINKSIGVMLACKLSTRGPNLIGARAELYTENFMR